VYAFSMPIFRDCAKKTFCRCIDGHLFMETTVTPLTLNFPKCQLNITV
jgi:hypothetical protein